jgi:hypothetical protein
MNITVLIILAVVASAAFCWLAIGVLQALTWWVARLGTSVHGALKRAAGSEPDAWLFALLVGLTRILILGLASLSFGLWIIASLFPVPALVSASAGQLAGVVTVLLLMRLIAVYVAAVQLGGSVRTVLKTLKS